MMYRTLTILLFVLLSCFTCLGQGPMMYGHLTPGESNKREVEQFLGQPLKKVSETLFEYKPRDESENYQLFVQYEKDTAIVEQIAFVFREKQNREAILKSYVGLGLVKPEATLVNAKGRLEEYFRWDIVLTHESDTPASSVIRKAYYSDRLFNAALKRPDPDSREVGEGAESKVLPTSKGYAPGSESLDGLVQKGWPTAR